MRCLGGHLLQFRETNNWSKQWSKPLFMLLDLPYFRGYSNIIDRLPKLNVVSSNLITRFR